MQPLQLCLVSLLLLASLAVLAHSASVSHSAHSLHRRKRAATPGYQHRFLSSMRPNGNWSSFLLNQHNDFRRQVPAKDMQALYWDPALARSAQRHADSCDFWHSKGRKGVGENIWAASYPDYSNAVTLWFDEVYDPACKCPHHFKACCGHYTQVVWAETNRLGCGAAKCRYVNGAPGQRYVLVCHYSPSGNVIVARNGRLNYRPAFQWQKDNATACSACPPRKGHSWVCDRGLCR